MRWPWQRRQPRASDEAIEATAEATQRLHAERQALAEARRLADSLRRARARNQFGDRLLQVYRDQ